MPKGYIIGHADVHDPQGYKAYAARNDEILKHYGGIFLMRGGAGEVREGATHPRHVIIEFPSYEAARAFYDSPEYQENLKIRQANADSVIVVAEGV